MDAKTFQQILGFSRMTVRELRETYLETFGEERFPARVKSP